MMRAMPGFDPANLSSIPSGGPSEGSSGAKDRVSVGASNGANTKSQTQPGTQKIIREIGGRDGPEPTRFGDWEKSGRCIDF